VCGKSARTVRSGGGQKRAHGDDYTGTKPETVDTDKSEPTGTALAPDPPIPLLGRIPHHRKEVTGRTHKNEQVPHEVSEPQSLRREEGDTDRVGEPAH